MAHYIGKCITPVVGSRHIANVLVPAGGLTAGQLVFCDNLATIDGNREVYVATQPATAGLGGTHLAMVVNGGLETLADGRRPAGQPDYTQYTFAEGDIATVVFLDAHLIFHVSPDVVTGGTAGNPTADIGKYIIPANGTNAGAVNASNTSVGNSLKIVGTANFPLGGLFGGQFATVYVCIAQ